MSNIEITPHSQATRLWRNGYFPLPCRGKAPIGIGWDSRQDPGTVPFYDYATVGIRCGDRGVLAIDVDIEDDELGMALEFALGLRGLKRIGRPGRRLLLVRVAAGVAPLSHDLTFEKDGRREAIQLLGKGKQFIAFGMHPDTGRLYEWPNGRSPLDTPAGDLLEVDQEALEQQLVEVASRYGWHQRVVARLSGVQQFDSIPRDEREREKLGKWGVGQVEDALAELRTMLPGTGRGNFSRDLGLRVGTLVCSGMLDGEQIARAIYDATSGDYNSAYHSFPRGCAMSVGKAAADMLETLRRGPGLLAQAVAMGLPIGFPEVKSLTDREKSALAEAVEREAERLGELRKHGGRPGLEHRAFANRLAALRDVGAMTAKDCTWAAEKAKCGTIPTNATESALVAARATVDALAGGKEAAAALVEGEKAGVEYSKATRSRGVKLANRSKEVIFDGTEAGAAALAASLLCGGTDDVSDKLVFSEGKLWRRNGHLWELVTDEEITVAINDSHGLEYQTGDAVKRFDVRHDRFERIKKTLAKDSAKPGFFDNADGIALGDCYVTVDGSGVKFTSYEEARANVRFALGSTEVDIRAAKFAGSKFESFLKDAMSGYGSKSDVAIGALQELIGIGVVGLMPKVKAPKLIYFYGASGSGKSTLIEIVRAVFDKGLVATFDPTKLDKDFQTASYAGKRFLLNNDVNVSAAALAGDELKKFVTGESVEAAEKHQPKFEFVPSVLIMLASNELPHFRGNRFDDGMKRRVAAFEFRKAIMDKDKRAGLAREIAAEESSVMLQWALEGASRVMTRKGEWSEAVAAFISERVTEWAKELDAVALFVADHVREADPAECSHAALTTVAAYQAFRAFFETHGFVGAIPARPVFGRRLSAALASAGLRFERPRDNNVRGFLGLKLAS
jgi:P4 family phage/plasmid primase-like protien